MAYRACIVEDDKDSSELLCAYLRDYGEKRKCEFTVTCFYDALEFLERFGSNYDFIFMDIELPHMDGMEAVRRIRKVDPDVIVIFVTNMAQYAVKGYEVSALDFIVKPVKFEAFCMKMDRAVSRLEISHGKDIWITDRNSKRRLRSSEILYIEVAHHNVIYHTAGGDYSVVDQMYNVCREFDGLPFALCNRCFLVNLEHVTSVEEFSVTVGGHQLQISRNKKKAFLESLNEYLGGK